MNPLLAQALVSRADEVSDAISFGWDNIWSRALDSEVYQSINNIGIALAISMLVLWLFKFYQTLQERGAAADWTAILLPVVIIFLLANGGARLKDATFFLRGFINETNNSVLTAINAGNELSNSLSGLSEFSSAQSQIASLRRQCDSFTINEQLTQCLTEQRQRADELISQLQAQGTVAPTWMQNLQESITNSFSTATGLVRAINSPGLLIAEAIIMAFQAAFQLAIEISMLLTGLMGPVAVGMSLLPIGAKPVYAWLTAFWSLGICKLSLNIITGLVAKLISDVGPTNIDTLTTAIALGLISPILAFGLSTGGGMAIFNGILQATNAALSGGVSMLKKG